MVCLVTENVCEVCDLRSSPLERARGLAAGNEETGSMTGILEEHSIQVIYIKQTFINRIEGRGGEF